LPKVFKIVVQRLFLTNDLPFFIFTSATGHSYLNELIESDISCENKSSIIIFP